MSKLYEKLNSESGHIKLAQHEKAAMRAAIFGAPSPLTVAQPARSPYAIFGATWARALAALVIVIGAGTGTAFASQGALPGEPLYAIKTQVIEPVELALATDPVAKASVHAQIAQERVAEAEALAQKGSLDATTSAELADSFELNAQSAVALADQASSTDPSAAVQIKAQLAVSSSVGGAILSALSSRGNNDRADAFAARVLAMVTRSDSAEHEPTASAASVRTLAVAMPAPKEAPTARTMAAFSASQATGTQTTEGEGSSSSAVAPAAMAVTAAVTLDGQKTAQGLLQKAQSALVTLKSQFNAASSTLDASTTVSIQTQLGGIDALIDDGSQALGDSIFDTATQDFTTALSRSLRLSALLEAQQTVDPRLIDPLLNNDSSDTGSGSDD